MKNTLDFEVFLMKKKIIDFLIVISGLALIAFAVSTLIAPNKIVQGGVSGMATIVYYLTGAPISLTNLLVNIVLIIIGLKILGKHFIIRTLACVLILSGFLEVFSFIPPLTDDRLLATLFGGILYGTGIGLTLLKGASSGGTDILGRIAQHFFPHIPIGKLLLFVDGLVILGGFVAFKDLNLVMYGMITIFISTFTIDYLIKKLNVSRLAFVVTSKGDDVSKKLISTSGRGVTKIDVTGAYTNEKKTMLMCAIKENEMPEFQRKIDEMDREAFTMFSESQQIFGNGFHVYK